MAIQMDPMPYLSKARAFAIEHISGKQRQYWQNQERGIFGDNYKMEFEKDQDEGANGVYSDEQMKGRLQQKMHSLYFPFTWQEVRTNSVNIMMMSGNVKSLEDVEYYRRALGIPNGGEADNAEIDQVPNKDRIRAQQTLMESSYDMLYTNESPSKFFELNDVLMQGLLTNLDIALIDMPEVLLRMKIANEHSLKDLQDIFNFVMNKLRRKDNPCISAASAAMFYFPDVFARPRDEYVAAMIKEIAMHKSEQEDSGVFNMSCYLGNVHVSPVIRLLKTFNSDGVYSSG